MLWFWQVLHVGVAKPVVGVANWWVGVTPWVILYPSHRVARHISVHLKGWRANFFYVVDSVHKSGRSFVEGAGRWVWHKMLSVKHRLTWRNSSFENAMILPSFSCGRGKTSSGRGQLMSGRDTLGDSLSIPPGGAPNFCHLMRRCANFFNVVDSVHKSGRSFVKGGGALGVA